MKLLFNLSLVLCLMNIQFVKAQTDIEFLTKFSKNILSNRQFDFKDYKEYVSYFNDYNSQSDSIEIKKYFNNIKTIVDSHIGNNIINQEHLKIGRIINDSDLKSKFLLRQGEGLKYYELKENSKLITYIVLNSKNEIVSFFCSVNKKNEKCSPFYLDEPLLRK